MRPPIHEGKEELFCNRCEKYVSKFRKTLIANDEVYCHYCGNWLCGIYDGFGIKREPTIVHIQIQGQVLTNV